MTFRLLSMLAAAAALGVGGCRICASPFDYAPPTDYDGGWENARRGSIFSDAYRYGAGETIPGEEVIVEEGDQPEPPKPQIAPSPAPPKIERQTSAGERVTMAGAVSARRRR